MNNDPLGTKTLEIMSQAYRYNTWLYRRIKPYLSGHIAEVGSGTGTFTKMLVADNYLVTTIDINPNYLAQINLDLQIKNLPHRLFNKFDTIVVLNVLEHIPNNLQAMSNLRQMLKDGGKLITLVPAGSWVYGSLDLHLGHVLRYEIDQVQKLMAQTGFKIIFQRYLNILGLIGWFVNGKLFKRKILPNHQLRIFDVISRPVLWLETKVRFPWGLSILTVAQKV